MTTTIILELTTLVVGAIIGYFIGAHNTSSAKKQQDEITEKIDQTKDKVENGITTS